MVIPSSLPDIETPQSPAAAYVRGCSPEGLARTVLLSPQFVVMLESGIGSVTVWPSASVRSAATNGFVPDCAVASCTPAPAGRAGGRMRLESTSEGNNTGGSNVHIKRLATKFCCEFAIWARIRTEGHNKWKTTVQNSGLHLIVINQSAKTMNRMHVR